jgi:hypothetical protein
VFSVNIIHFAVARVEHLQAVAAAAAAAGSTSLARVQAKQHGCMHNCEGHCQLLQMFLNLQVVAGAGSVSNVRTPQVL